MFTIPLRLASRVMIAAVLALAGAATPALAAPIGDGTSNTIQLAVTSVRLDQVHHRVSVSAPVQQRLVAGMHLGTVEIVKPAEHLTLLLENCLISGDTATGFVLNFSNLDAVLTSPPDARLIESDGIYPPLAL